MLYYSFILFKILFISLTIFTLYTLIKLCLIKNIHKYYKSLGIILMIFIFCFSLFLSIFFLTSKVKICIISIDNGIYYKEYIYNDMFKNKIKTNNKIKILKEIYY
jgi:hypothetical protein